MPESLTVFVEVDGDAQQRADELRAAVTSLAEVGNAEVQVEDLERSDPTQIIESITLTLTAASAAVGAANLLLNQVEKLLREMRGVRRALLETEAGVHELSVGSAAPRKENPAQK